MNNSVLDFLTEALDNEKLFDKVNRAKTREELYELYNEFNSENCCDKESFGKYIDELLEEYLPLESLDDSQIENVSGGADTSKFNRVAASLLSVLSISGTVVPSMSTYGVNSKRVSSSTMKAGQTHSFFERHPNLRKLAIGGGTIGTIALGATALYLLSNKNSENSEESNSNSKSTSQTANSSRINNEQSNLVNGSMSNYSDSYWPEKLGNKPLGNDLSKIDIHPPFVMLARSNGEDVAEIEPIEKSILDRIHFVKGDITKDVKVDCIVNAANNALGNGTGVCGGIFNAAGSNKLSDEITDLKKQFSLNEISNGSAIITKAHGITTAKNIIHTPGPDMRGYMNKPKNACLELASSYGASIELAAKNGLKSIAFPSISTGIFGFPVEKASLIALYTAVKSLDKHKDMNVYFVVFPGSSEEKTYNEMMKTIGKSYENEQK